jgi:CubicO group peptidase (beta-lactamase class C family)
MGKIGFNQNLFNTLMAIMVPLLMIVPMLACSSKNDVFPIPSWSTSTPEEQGLDSAKLAEGLLAIKQKGLNIHSLLIVRNGSVVLDAYFYHYDGKIPHRLASVTKSVMTTLIAIAADQGKLKLDQSMLSFFPERNILNVDDLKKRITVRHLASMSSGLESVGMEQDEGTLNEMMASKDYIQFALDRKVVSEPGKHFVYDSPSTHILSAILQKATGMTAEEFAMQNLFGPLGIKEVYWEVDPQGFTHGWSDLFLKPPDVAKIGYLWLERGKWGDKQIVSSNWVDASVRTQLKTGLNDDYGYGWWITEEKPHEYAAIGRGGQRIQVYPQLNIVIVITAGGAEYDEIVAEIAPAVVDTKNPLKAKLNTVIQEISQPPVAILVPPLPSTAREISGKTISFQSNPFQLKTVKLDFTEQPEATMHLTFTGSRSSETAKVGLDGVYRIFSENDIALRGYRGYWADETTFLFDYNDITRGEAYDISFKFSDKKVIVEGKERSHEALVTFEGSVQ